MTQRSARVLIIPLIIVNDRPRASFLHQRPYLVFVLAGVYNILFMVDGKDLFTVKTDLNKGLIFLWEPEPINFLVLPHEIGPLNPERQSPRGMTFDSDD